MAPPLTSTDLLQDRLRHHPPQNGSEGDLGVCRGHTGPGPGGGRSSAGKVAGENLTKDAAPPSGRIKEGRVGEFSRGGTSPGLPGLAAWRPPTGRLQLPGQEGKGAPWWGPPSCPAALGPWPSA